MAAEVLDDNERPVDVNVVGERSKKQWVGHFVVKLDLSMADCLAMDRFRREMLGPVTPEAAYPRAANIAQVLSELSVHVVRGPAMWVETRGFLDVIDDAPVKSLYDQLSKHLEELAKSREIGVAQAKEELREASSPEAPAPK